MVLRDKNTPKLYFDNPLYNTDTQGASRPGPETKTELHVSKSVNLDIKPKEKIDKRRSNLSHAGFMASKCSGSNRLSASSYLHSPEIFMPAASLTPDCDFEEHILENIRNRDFWSRRSRKNPFRNKQVASRTATPVRAGTPGSDPEVPPQTTPRSISFMEEDDDIKEEKEDAEEEDIIASEMMLEAQRETRLRENICWLRNNLIETSEATSGKFSLSSFLTTMCNKVSDHDGII